MTFIIIEIQILAGKLLVLVEMRGKVIDWVSRLSQYTRI